MRVKPYHSPTSLDSGEEGVDPFYPLSPETKPLMDRTLDATADLREVLTNFLVAYGNQNRSFARLAANDLNSLPPTLSDARLLEEARAVAERHVFTVTVLAERLLDERLEPLLFPLEETSETSPSHGASTSAESTFQGSRTPRLHPKRRG